MRWSKDEHSRVGSPISSMPVFFRFYEWSLVFFQTVVEGVGRAFMRAFRLMIAIQEWMSRRFV